MEARPVWHWRWWILGLFAVAWTAALLYPEVPDVGLESTHELLEIRTLIGKAVHVSAYAVLAGLAGWVRAPVRYRTLLVFGVMAHATATELGQWWMHEMEWSRRHGQLTDVALDNLGILLGLMATWKWWTQEG